jgi:hypothetical protein
LVVVVEEMVERRNSLGRGGGGGRVVAIVVGFILLDNLVGCGCPELLVNDHLLVDA